MEMSHTDFKHHGFNSTLKEHFTSNPSLNSSKNLGGLRMSHKGMRSNNDKRAVDNKIFDNMIKN
jgi:hypothetical protein